MCWVLGTWSTHEAEQGSMNTFDGALWLDAIGTRTGSETEEKKRTMDLKETLAMAMAMAHSNEVSNQVSQPCPMDSNGGGHDPEKNLLGLFKDLHICRLCASHSLK